MAAVVDSADSPSDLVAVAPPETDDSMMLSIEELAHSKILKAKGDAARVALRLLYFRNVAQT